MKMAKGVFVAVAVSVVGLLLASGVAGLVQAQAEPVKSVQLPAITPETQAVYDIRQLGNAPPFVLHRMDVRWANEPGVLQADQSLQDSATMEVRIPYTFGSPHHYSSDVYSKQRYDPRAGEYLGLSIWEDFPEGNEQVWHRSDSWGALQGICGMWTPMHGAAIPIGSVIDLGGACVERDVPGRSLFVFEGIETLDGLDALRFGNLHNPDVQVWYNPGFQVPVKLVVELEDLIQPGKTRGTLFELTLTHYAPGDGSFSTAKQLTDAPTIRTQPAPTGRVDDSAMNLPFTLDDAVAAARADGRNPRVQDYQARYAGMYLAYVRVETDENQWGLVSYDYRMMWTNGEAWIGKLVEYSRDGPLSAIETEQQVDVSPWSPPWLTDGRPVPEGYHPTIPQRAPTLAVLDDVLDAWTYHAEGRFANATPEVFGFAHWCGMDCDQVTGQVFAGVHREGYRSQTTAIDIGVPETPDDLRNKLYVDQEGRLISHDERIEQGPAGLFVRLDDASHTQPENQAVDVSAAAASWALPSTTFFVVAGASAAGLGILLWQLVQRGALLAGFSRITQAAVLANPQRSVVHDLITQSPGIHLKEIKRRSGFGSGAVTHHVGKLLDTRMIQEVQSAGYTCYFPTGSMDHRLMRATGAVKSSAARSILAEVVRAGQANPVPLAKALNLSPGTVSHHLKRLADAGLVQGGGRAGYTPTELADSALAA